jgi:hypothetical protein
MINRVNSIDTVIEGVEEVTLQDITGSWHGGVQRVLVIRTKHNENFYLKLQAEMREQLEFVRDPGFDGDDKESDWLNPKVYKGKSEEELDE